jgi:hypothetical protein
MAVGFVVHRARRGRRDGRSGESGDRQNKPEQGEQVSARGGHGIGSKDSRRCGRSLQYGRKSELNRLMSLSYYLTDSRKGDSCQAPKVPHSPDRMRGGAVIPVKAHAGPRGEDCLLAGGGTLSAAAATFSVAGTAHHRTAVP